MENKRCVFCGNVIKGANKSNKSNKSKEHIFPQWLQDHLDLKQQAIFPTLYTTIGEVDKYRQMTFNGFLSGFVCEPCNTGWMSKLEDAVKPILLGLIDGNYAGKLTTEDSGILARWSVKTALAIYSAHSAWIQDLFVPDEHYKSIARGDVPERVVVSAARIQPEGDYYWIQSQNWYGQSDGLTLDDFRRTYRFTMRFGRFAARVHYWPLEPRYMREHFADCIVHLWHSGPRSITWPPSGMIHELQEFDESLWLLPSNAA